MLDTRGTIWGVPSAYAYGGLPTSVLAALMRLLAAHDEEDSDACDKALQDVTDTILLWHRSELRDVAKLAPGYIVFGCREQEYLDTGKDEAQARGLTIYARARNAKVNPLEQKRREEKKQ